LVTGRDIRPRGQECRRGEPLLPAGTVVTPAVLGLAAAAGRDELTARRRPAVELFVLGDELLTSGVPSGGRIRDALGPMLPSWLRSYGASGDAEPRRLPDLGALTTALRSSTADVVVTTGGTAAGPVDHLHDALRELGADLLVDGVSVRPGHPMLLVRLAPGRWLVGLPGNPLAAVAGAATLAEPLLRALAGLPETEPYRCPTTVALPGYPQDTRLVPVLLPERGAVPLAFDGPAMLRGLALAEGLAVVPPGGVAPGQPVEVLEVPGGANGSDHPPSLLSQAGTRRDPEVLGTRRSGARTQALG
jgi:molybdopterin molybdotransferase